MGILDAQVPSQRWALPSDSLYDKHYNQFELWVNDIYKFNMQYTEYGLTCSYDEALGDDELFQVFMDEKDYERMP